ncbi:MAG TPA: glycosyltransferase family 39 protein [Verrucomicrobiae bacterium]|nr:glycosyltransferase family 39 protein [Verrucomicrobiae bacterium]
MNVIANNPAAQLLASSKSVALGGWIRLALVAVFAELCILIPLGSAVQVGSDEGFELVKVTLYMHGYRLYTDIWNDQPPLHTFLVAQALKHTSESVLVPRLITVSFAVVLLASLYALVNRITGRPMLAFLTILLLIACPGFLELSSSCMLEMPSLATAVAALSVLLIMPRDRWRLREVLAGILFGSALQMKLVPMYLLPLVALLLLARRLPSPGSESQQEETEITERHPGWGSFCLGRTWGRGEAPGFRGGLFADRRALALFAGRLVVFGVGLMGSYVLIDLLIDGGAFLRNFGQTWSSHFARARSFEYGSASDYPYDWGVLLRNWDVTLPALAGALMFVRRARVQPMNFLPVAWLALSILVFAIHRPWWSYYYIHNAIPLCWCAGVGIEWAATVAFVKWGLAGARPSGWRLMASPRHGEAKEGGSRAIALLFATYLAVSVPWMVTRVYLEIRGIRNSPQLYNSLVLDQIKRLKPFTQWMYADRLVYSFHAGIPIPPPIAVVPLKRLWAGEMTSARMATEMQKYRPGIVLLRNDSREVPFQALLTAEYRLVYEDQDNRLYAHESIRKKAGF